MAQKVVPVTEVKIPEGKSYGWQPIVENNRFVGLYNPNYGRIEHFAVVDEDEDGNVRYLYDIPKQWDGPFNEETGHSKPNALIVPVEEREDGFYIHCHEEFRPVIYDHIRGIQGVTVVSFAGGFSKKFGKDPRTDALRELLDEEGIEVEDASVERIGIATPNRAFVETCFEVYIGRFKRKAQEPTPEGDEIIGSSRVYRIDEFPVDVDAIVNNVYAMLVSYLSVVSPMILVVSAANSYTEEEQEAMLLVSELARIDSEFRHELVELISRHTSL